METAEFRIAGTSKYNEDSPMPQPIQLETERLILLAGTLDIARAEARDRAALSALLGANIHPGWPPDEHDKAAREFFLGYLTEHPDAVGFMGWSWLLRAKESAGLPLLIGGGGFKGLPSEDGTVEIGYSIVEEYYGRGLATEAVRALVAWAFGDARVGRIIAETLPHLRASQRVLEKNGFVRAEEAAADLGAIRYTLPRETWMRRAQ